VLRAQIEQGAPADVLAFADVVHADALRQSGALREYRIFARNALGVVVPARDARVRRLGDLARPGVKVVVAGATVPVGRYAMQVLDKLAASGLHGDDFRARVQANVVSQETNVRAVLAKVALGEADAGFVYLTDASVVADRVETLVVPDQYNVVPEYPIARLARSEHPHAAGFVDWVLGSQGRRVLSRHGFR
jgi:molybdate transport system substrate-binding protein